jgi:hypothetical protein
MSDATDIGRVVGFIQGKLWYRVQVGWEAAQRAKELATGGVGPQWVVRPEIVPSGLSVVVETTDPEWFTDLEQKIKQVGRMR